MQSCAIHRNLLDYEKKVGRVLTVRTAAFTAAAVGGGVGAGAACWFCLGLPWSVSQFVVFGIAVPLWLMGFARPAGMRPEAWWPYGRRTLFGKTRLTYEVGGRGPQGRPGAGSRKGGEWDVLQKAWERRWRRAHGVELLDPDGGWE